MYDAIRPYLPFAIFLALGLAVILGIMALSPEGYQDEKTNTFHEGKQPVTKPEKK